MMSSPVYSKPRRLRGGLFGPLSIGLFVLGTALLLLGIYLYPRYARSYGYNVRYNEAMFGPLLEQPIPFSHRLHVTDKQIDCFYCHPYGERSLNTGLPSVAKCLGCHDHIIPEHKEIKKLRAFKKRGEHLPWVRVYYNPDHVFFPHFRHLAQAVECEECHGEVERADRLHQVTFYMGFCIDCHKEREAPRECTNCHQ